MKLRSRVRSATMALALLALGTLAVFAQNSPVRGTSALSARLTAATRVATQHNGTGYWIATADGSVQAFGSAVFYGSMQGRRLNAPIVGILATGDGRGYWLVARDGAVFAFGDAAFEGSLGGNPYVGTVVGIASSSTAGSANAGPQGPTGRRGAAGSAGVAGAIGISGGAGVAGATGATGSNGTNGTTGPTGSNGTNGTTGPTGNAGANGATGATGAQGPARVVNYAFVYNFAAQTVAVEGDVTFDSNGPLSGFSHSAGGSAVTVTSTGVYVVNTSVSATELAQFAVTVNGIVVPQTTYGSGAGTQQDNGQAILNLAAGDVIRLRNHSSPAAVGLPTVAGGTQANVNASLLIQQLG